MHPVRGLADGEEIFKSLSPGAPMSSQMAVVCGWGVRMQILGFDAGGRGTRALSIHATGSLEPGSLSAYSPTASTGILAPLQFMAPLPCPNSICGVLACDQVELLGGLSIVPGHVPHDAVIVLQGLVARDVQSPHSDVVRHTPIDDPGSTGGGSICEGRLLG
ncbi:hypothetical protein LX36DRAFT_185513 [Colletotrichum falcatum]|nr:hypothetical protein LX36DRAFT_185513 [Colletotrichum falcatum]